MSSGRAKLTFISAGAGSGKTHRLTEILHEELTGKNVRPSGVIATTFTKKAATELRERVRGHLLSRGDFALANAMGQARIGTVNSVCGDLISRFAFEAGIATEQQVLDEIPANALLAKAIDGVLDGPAMGSFLTVVRRLGLLDAWKDELKTLVDMVRANDLEPAALAQFASRNAGDLLAQFPPATKDDLTAQLRESIEAALPTVESTAQGGKKNTGEYLALLREMARSLAIGNAAWSDWIKLSKKFPEVALKPLAEPIADLANRAPEHSGLHDDIRRYLAQIFDLCGQSLIHYARMKRELGVLDFADQEHQLLQLLDHPTLIEVLGDELDLLLVDEFQDTSPIQLALFLRLTRFAKAVYWVGDVKQAIYGFRGSDSELMQAILKALPDMGGAQEVLPSSWRSRPELVKLVNSIFGHTFANSLPRREIELTAMRKDQLPGAPLANWVLGGKNVDQEASALAAGVRKLVDSRYQVIDKGATAPRDVRFGDIAVLCRSHDSVTGAAAALHAQAIPSATAHPGLMATPEATLALTCLRRLNDPSDTIATVEILALADCRDPEDWVADRLRHIQSCGDPDSWMEIDTSDRKAHPLIAKLGAMRRDLPLLAPREALQTVIVECGLSATVLRWSSDPDLARVRLANLEELLALATQYEDLCRAGQHAASVSGLILWFGELVGDEKDMLPEPGIDAVKIMTHHAAKGLEWPVVILKDLAVDIKDRLWSIYAQSSGALDVQAPLVGRTIRYWPWPFGAQKSVGVADKIGLTSTAEAFRKAAVEESKRLLYVSMTRARDLMILARSSRKPSGPWLDCIEAPWLLQAPGADEITLPDGSTMPAVRWDLDPVDESTAAAASAQTTLYWFAEAAEHASLLPLFFNPSNSERCPATILEKLQIGERVPVGTDADMSLLGSAIHACIATSFTDSTTALSSEEIEKILAAFGVSQYVSATAILRQVSALHEWIAGRWGQATSFAEYPVQCVLGTGQVLNGRIDLLLRTAAGWVLIDHKSSATRSENWESLASEYAAQLSAYAAAIEKASGRAVAESWLYLPVAAGGLRVK